jgi:cytidine deaminase
MAITAASDSNKTIAPIPPCGSCRQSIAEYETQETPIEIYFMGETGDIYKSDSLKNLLPFMFDKTSKKTKKKPFNLLLDGMSYFCHCKFV